MNNSQFLAEWRQIFTNKKLLIPIIAILFIPILYAGMFLWSFWDPYDRLEELPVAIVNEDNGVFYEDDYLTLGDDLVEKLKENEVFQFHFVSRDEAYSGLEKQTYYMVVEIPENFSENATTLLDTEPEKLSLKYVPNEGYNFLSAQIGETAAKEIKTAIASELTATYAETMFDKIGEMADGFEQASDGAGSIEDGTGKLKDGSLELKENLEMLAAKSLDFQDGVDAAHSGAGDIESGTDELAQGIGQLSAAGKQLLDAADSLTDGSAQLADGIAEANDGVQEIDKKLPELVQGTAQVKEGIKEFQKQLPASIADAMAGKLNDSAEQMADGLDELQEQLSQQLAAGIAAQITSQQADTVEQLANLLIANGLDKNTAAAIKEQMQAGAPSEKELQNNLYQSINAGIGKGFDTFESSVTEQLSGATSGLENQIKTAVDPTFNQLSAGITAISEGQAALQNGIGQLADGTQKLQEGSVQLNEGQQRYLTSMDLFTDKLAEAGSGADKLATGAATLNKGMGTLADGAEKISSGSHQLADGSEQLSDGTEELYEGTVELHDKLGNAAEQAGSVNSDQDTYDMMGEPVTLDKEEINSVPNYGTGFAPYFISLGLFVGSLLITIVFPLKEPVIPPRNGLAWFWSKFGVLAAVGIFQALVVDIVLLLWLGIEVQSISLFILISIITSLTFMTLIQLLVTLFNDAGRFIAIIILILQLTTSAGTFPLELIPKVIQPIHAALPMTYTVHAFKAVISSGDYSFMWKNVGILVLYILGAILLTAAYFIVKHSRGEHAGDQEEQFSKAS